MSSAEHKGETQADTPAAVLDRSNQAVGYQGGSTFSSQLSFAIRRLKPARFDKASSAPTEFIHRLVPAAQTSMPNLSLACSGHLISETAQGP
jgi:hypothetical protein